MREIVSGAVGKAKPAKVRLAGRYALLDRPRDRAGPARRQRVDVCQRRAEVDDARTQREPAVHHRVREERLTAPLDARQQFLIQLLQIRFGVRRSDGLQVARDVAERRDAEMLRHRLEVRMLLDERVQVPRQAHVVADHLQIAGRADLTQRQPHLQRPEAARVLRTVVEVVGDLLIEVVVAGMVRERAQQIGRTPDQRAARFERRIEPLVRIDRH